eukprot:14375634-Alexandrium_andersonii.AAC.1
MHSQHHRTCIQRLSIATQEARSSNTPQTPFRSARPNINPVAAQSTYSRRLHLPASQHVSAPFAAMVANLHVAQMD